MIGVEYLTVWVHVAAGVVALAAGAVALATRKGGHRHRLAGRSFVAAMAVVAATAIALYPLGPSDMRRFLVMVAIFSFYFAFSGYRVLSRKRPADRPGPLDWVATALLAGASAWMAGTGVLWALDDRSFAPMLLVFGAIGLAFAGTDLRGFLGGGEGRPAWRISHLQRMIAAYIATVSAVSAVNLHALPPAVRWLWPTAVGVPIIFYMSRRYQRANGANPRVSADD